jgi:hypothetical protein
MLLFIYVYLQRLGYYKARYLAVRDKRTDNKEGHVTIIIDGMDQNTTMLPWYPRVRRRLIRLVR